MSDINKLELSVPISKVDKERRLVSGFATLDNIDKQGDIIPAATAKAAFDQFRGNLRLMHNPIPVGKVIDFKEDKYYDAETGKMYNGIFVTAYVSKGAENYWEMVLDGTLTGFSIGAKMKDHEVIIDKGVPVRVIKEMELYELSLVDSPANQFANILSIQKSDNTVTGMSADLDLNDIFYCKSCEILSPGEEGKSCIKCEDSMEHIGWIERVSPSDDREKMSKLLDEYLASESEGSDRADNGLLKQKGGSSMEKGNAPVDQTEEVVEKAVETAPDSDAGEAAELEKAVADEATEEVSEEGLEKSEESEEAEEVVEKSEEAESVESEEVVVEKTDEAPDLEAIIKSAISESLVTFTEQQNEAVTKAVAEALSSTDEKLTAMKEEINAAIADVKKSADVVESRLEEYEGATAVKKSGELGGSPEQIKKSVWNGALAPKHFFDSNSIIEER